MKKSKIHYDNMLNFYCLDKIFNKLKTTTKNKREVFKFYSNLNQNLMDILIKIKNRDYKFGKYRIFIIREPKYRLIMSESMADKLVNHLFTETILKPALEPCLIDTNVATREKKGSALAYASFEKAVNRLKYTKKEIYCLKIDIKKYFYNIDHKILLSFASDKIKDKECLKFLEMLLDTTNQPYVNREITLEIERHKKKVNSLNISNKEKMLKIKELDSIPRYKEGKGLPIGNLSSQLLAVFYLNHLDHFIKEDLKCKNYVRYMDDLVIIDTDKEKLKHVLEIVGKKVNDYTLVINNKSNIFSLRQGVSFLGYKYVLRDNKLIIRYRTQTSRRIARRLRNLKIYNNDKYINSKGSYRGYLKKCNTNLYNYLWEKL